MTRRDLLGCLPGAVLAAEPKLLPGTPQSAGRMAAIAAMRRSLDALGDVFESGVLGLPYRLFRAKAPRGSRLPLVVYLHGAGGLGDDNKKQISGGNLFGSHLWALPEIQSRHPCHIVAPQTSFGWIRYDQPRVPGGPRPKAVAGFGKGAELAVQIVTRLIHELAVDESRIYVMGNSMGGGGTWHMLAHRGDLFAAGVPVAGGASEDSMDAVKRPVWNFHGDADKTVPVTVSRERIAALRKLGRSPLYTEYAGVGHDANQWAFSEPALVDWLFAQRR